MNKLDHIINDYNRFIKSSNKFINQIKKKTEEPLNNIMVLKIKKYDIKRRWERTRRELFYKYA